MLLLTLSPPRAPGVLVLPSEAFSTAVDLKIIPKPGVPASPPG